LVIPFKFSYASAQICDTVFLIGHAWGRGKMFEGFLLGGPKGRDHWEDIGIGGRITLRWTSGR
jgi:hypothetical protein